MLVQKVCRECGAILGVGVTMLALCLLNLDLKSLASPTYVWVFLPPSDVTVT